MSSSLRPTPVTEDLALVLGGGGARGAYQAGVLRYIARQYPHLRIPILVGISAGAVNTIHLASHRGTFQESVEHLVRLWFSLTPERVYRVDARTLLSNVVRSGVGLVSGEPGRPDRVRGMVDTAPLRRFLENALERSTDGTLPGIAGNLARGSLNAVALTATSYTTGQSVTWVQGRSPVLWERPQRRSEQALLGVDHVMASAALPLLFPAERVGDEWYGDGGIRLTAPLSPALHLGASRILTIATRSSGQQSDASDEQKAAYPPPAQVLGTLYNAVFLDLIDQDIVRLNVINQLISKIPPNQREGMRLVEILVIRPSVDLASLAREYEPQLPSVFRFLTRGLGTKKSASAAILSLIMFQEDYLRRLVALGEADGARNHARIARFIEGETALPEPEDTEPLDTLAPHDAHALDPR
ncbi:MAG: patatin-like phospholipase family protein [Gemmatimonadaceae bacterium]